MFIYIFLLIILFLCAIINRSPIRNKKQSNLFYSLCLCLSLVGGLRYRLGIDSIRYANSFETIPKIFEFESYSIESISQPIWFLINSLAKTVIDDFVIVQLFHALIVNFLIGRFIAKTCIKPFWALFIYYCIDWCYFNFEIMRESLCVSIYLNILLDYIKTHDIKKFILYSIPLILIHWFAFIPVAITILSFYIPKKQFILVSIFTSLCIYLFVNKSNIDAIMYYINFFISDDAFGERINMYLDSDKSGFISVSLLGLIFIIITQIYPSLLIVKKGDADSLVSKLLILYACFVLMRIKLLIADRFLNYYEIILVVYSINALPKLQQSFRLYMQCILIYLTLNGIHSFYTPLADDTSKHDCRYIPYSSYIDKKLDPQRERYFSYKVL